MKEMNPSDERNVIDNNPVYNSLRLSLSRYGEKLSGHNLYSYYQLQGPVAKALINTEYYCYTDDEIRYTIYLLLTEDLLKKDTDGKTIIPEKIMDTLGQQGINTCAINLRYSAISGVNVTDDELKFLEEFSESSLNAGKYRFMLPKKYATIDFSILDRIDFNSSLYQNFRFLDKVEKYYLVTNFTSKELISFNNYIELLRKSNVSVNMDIFINMSIYFKYLIRNELKLNNFFFDEQVFGRIDNYCTLIKAFQPFDSNSKRLVENEKLFSEEKKSVLISKIEQEKQNDEISPSVLEDVFTDISNYDIPFREAKQFRKELSDLCKYFGNSVIEIPDEILIRFPILKESLVEQAQYTLSLQNEYLERLIVLRKKFNNKIYEKIIEELEKIVIFPNSNYNEYFYSLKESDDKKSEEEEFISQYFIAPDGSLWSNEDEYLEFIGEESKHK